ncbi:hypothetical protein FISHEDRAFT_58509 [Fistulina hepatica ATCC 64428]|uniref:BAG domain-containing protein n=1 Tax=Fistulina hepatica ATCC 64428 TaxID=1128425 RepID=A0A0D7AEG1_9AGAR|nr:hypothetical protein FISHEDRAFT_58509 [Fistulina hepatica ATCC 64428]
MVVVKWGKEKYYFPLPPTDTKLGIIRGNLAETTHLDPSSFKLVHGGAIMKDDNAPISAYHITDNSVIALIGTADPLPPLPSVAQQQSAAAQRSEQSTISQITSELEKVRAELAPGVDMFLASLSGHVDATAHLDKERSRLGELLLQALLRLDAITFDRDWEQAREHRRGAVKEVQSLLDRLDGAWNNPPRAE